MEDRDARIGYNEALFRAVNEELGAQNAAGARLPSFEIVCECGSASCKKLITVTAREYESVRSRSNQFLVKPGHQIEEVEAVIDEIESVNAHETYLIVTKRPGKPTRIAEATDPRR